MTDPRSVAIVIPTYNNARLLRECLLSLRDLDYPRDKLQVIVVDNASRDGTAEAMGAAGRSLSARHVNLDTNTGFAYACNQGAREADTEWVAFLNDDAIADKDWLNAMFAVADEVPTTDYQEPPICIASRILSRDGSAVEYAGASANLFGAGRPVPVWGWPDMPEPPGEGSPVLFASGGAMLIHRRTFLDVGGFDPEYFAYFEDVDLGWRLWLLGHRVAYAPGATVRHIGGATGGRSSAHKRYTLWECNSLATVLKNYETGNMERILSAALLLEYKRALMSAGDAVKAELYNFTCPREENPENVERLPRVSVAHIAAINRFNRLLPHFMRERRRIQARRVRSDREILPLMGHLWQPQFAGARYADAARQLFSRLDLYGLARDAMPLRTLMLAEAGDKSAESIATKLANNSGASLVALAYLSHDGSGATTESETPPGYTRHHLTEASPALRSMLSHADALVAIGEAAHIQTLRETDKPIALLGTPGIAPTLSRARRIAPDDWDALLAFCRDPQARDA